MKRLVLVSLKTQTRKTWGSLKILKKNYIAIVDIDIVDIDIGKNFLDFVEEMKGRKDILATSIDK